MGLADRIRRFLSGVEFERHEEYFRERHLALGGADLDFEKMRPAYRFGFSAAGDQRYRGRDFEAVEVELRQHWTADLARQCGSWESARSAINRGFHRAQGALAEHSAAQLALPTPRSHDVAVAREVATEPAARPSGPQRTYSSASDDAHP